MDTGPGPSTRRARARARITRLQQRRDAAVRRAEEARRFPAVDFAFSTGEFDRDSGGALLAGALAFRLFLWVLPAALVVAGCLGFVPPSEASGNASDAGLGAATATAVAEAAAQAHQGRWLLLGFGLVTLYWASVTLARTLWVATALAWQIPLVKLHRPARAAAVVTGALTVAMLAGFGANWLRGQDRLWGMVASLAVVLVFTLLGWGALCLLPHPADTTPKDLLPGGLVIGIGSQVLHLVTVLYLADRVTTELYGALGTAATLLLWGYLLARTLIGASTVNRTWHTNPLSLPVPRIHP